MADITRRFRAASALLYANALLVLLEQARGHARGSGDFSFGPVGSVGAIMDNGLTVSGPQDVVEELTRLLEREVPGLYESD